MLFDLMNRSYSVKISQEAYDFAYNKIVQYIYLMEYWWENALNVIPQGEEWDENHIVSIRTKKANSTEYWLLYKAVCELEVKFRMAHNRAINKRKQHIVINFTHLERHIIDTEKILGNGQFQYLIESGKKGSWEGIKQVVSRQL